MKKRQDICEICLKVLNGIDEIHSLFIKVGEGNIKFSNLEQILIYNLFYESITCYSNFNLGDDIKT